MGNSLPAATRTPDFVACLTRRGRIFAAEWLLVMLQLRLALSYASLVPALATGIGGTLFGVVDTSAKIGMVLP